jgi:SAM-dependent methyltransferase
MSKIEKFNWDDRFSTEEYVYGTEPNVFFKEQLDKLKPGKLLLLGEGEGRNAVYAAKLNWEVDAFDFSDQARVKALKLAEREHVNINYTVTNLIDYKTGIKSYDAIAIIFFHLERPELVNIFLEAQKALRQGGIIISEVFSVSQIGNSSGGPKDPELLYTVNDFESMFKGLENVYLEECSIELDEGMLHQGKAKVIRYIGRK